MYNRTVRKRYNIVIYKTIWVSGIDPLILKTDLNCIKPSRQSFRIHRFLPMLSVKTIYHGQNKRSESASGGEVPVLESWKMWRTHTLLTSEGDIDLSDFQKVRFDMSSFYCEGQTQIEAHEWSSQNLLHLFHIPLWGSLRCQAINLALLNR